MPSTERTKIEKNPLIVTVLTMIILLYFLPQSQDHFYRIQYVSVRVSVAEFDVDDGASMLVL